MDFVEVSRRIASIKSRASYGDPVKALSIEPFV